MTKAAMAHELPVDVEYRKCPECGNTMSGSRQSYQYRECGLSSVRLENVLVFECKCGNRSPEIRAVDILHQMIALDLLRKKSLLSGEEIRFLRKMAGLTQAEFAEVLGTDKTRPSKWESGNLKIGKENDRVIRSCCLFGILQQLFSEGDPTPMMISAKESIRKMDVREIFRQIDETTSKSEDVSLTHVAGNWLTTAPAASVN